MEQSILKNVLVVGGGGFVGLSLAKLLLRRGCRVTVLGRHRYPAAEQLQMDSLVADIADKDALEKAINGFDTVFHVAAKAGVWGAWQSYYQSNCLGTENVIGACKKNRIPVLVYTSTPSVVFDRCDISCGDEALPYPRHFLCHYARSKMMAEKMVLHANGQPLKTAALRPHLVWGPGDTNLIPRLLERGRRGVLKRVGDGKNLVDISYIDNVAEAHVLAAENLHQGGAACGKAYFISQGDPVNLWNWINDLFNRLGIPKVEKQVSFKTAYWVGALLELVYRLLGRNEEPLMTRFVAEQLAKSHWFSVDAARRDFGYVPQVSTEKGLEQMIGWLRENSL